MAKLGREDIAHVAKLAKLALTPSEITKFGTQLSEVVSYFEELNEIDTSAVEPTSQTTGIENVLREDEEKPDNWLDQKDALSGTENVHNGYFVVPRILEERTGY